MKFTGSQTLSVRASFLSSLLSLHFHYRLALHRHLCIHHRKLYPIVSMETRNCGSRGGRRLWRTVVHLTPSLCHRRVDTFSSKASCRCRRLSPCRLRVSSLKETLVTTILSGISNRYVTFNEFHFYSGNFQLRNSNERLQNFQPICQQKTFGLESSKKLHLSNMKAEHCQ